PPPRLDRRRRRRRARLALRLGEHALVVLDDLAGDGRGGDGERRGEVEPAGAGAALVVAVDRRHGDLIGAIADTRAAADARAAARLDDLDAGAPEQLGVAVVARVGLDVLRAELDVEPDAVGDLLAGALGLGHHAGVHVDVVALAGGARAAVGDVDLDAADLGDERAVLGIARDAAIRIARGRDHRPDRGEIDPVDAAGVRGVRIRRDDLLAKRRERAIGGAAGAPLRDPPQHG